MQPFERPTSSQQDERHPGGTSPIMPDYTQLLLENKTLRMALETSISANKKCVGILKDARAAAMQTRTVIGNPEPAPHSFLNYMWQGKHGPSEYRPVGPKPGGTSAGAMFEKTPTCLRRTHKAKLWLGKVSNKHRYSIYEKISSDMLQFFGVYGPKTRLASLPVLNPFTEADVWATSIANGDPSFKSTFLMSKWMDGYNDIGERFVDAIITSGSVPNPTTVYSGEKQVPLRGFMRAAAITKFVADTDFLGGTGKNAGYVIHNENGTEYAEFVKIDTGEAFSFRETTNIERDRNLRNSQDICIANGATRHLVFAQLTADQKKEFLQTMSRIITTPAQDFDLLVRRNGAFGTCISESDILTLTDTLKSRQYLMVTLYGQDIAMYLQDLQAVDTLHMQGTIQKAAAICEGVQSIQNTIDQLEDVTLRRPVPILTPGEQPMQSTSTQQQPGYPPQPGYLPTYPPQSGYPPFYPPQPGYPPFYPPQPGYPPYPQPGYPPYPPHPGYPPQPGYPPLYTSQPGYPPQPCPPQTGYLPPLDPY
ncbi:hypothetical protein Pelo_7873 [Pelomyxa schiedti]|nr:hypothetical protein Pelo_7873 [Pelomyxa schiedti]